MIELREMNPLSLAADWLIEQTDKTKFTQEDLVERCRLGEIKLFAAVPDWNDGGDGEIGWMERVGKLDPRAQATGIVLGDDSVWINEAPLVSVGKFTSGDGLIAVTPEMASRLLDHGKSSLSCARMTVFQCGPADPTPLDEPLIGTHDGRMVNFSHLRVKKSALEAFAAHQERANLNGTLGADDSLNVSPERLRVTGVNRNRIIAAFPAPIGRTGENWKKMLGDPPRWLARARISNGKPSVSALWNPARFAMALHDKRHMTLENLTDIMRRVFPGWLQEWEEYTASFE